MLELVFRTEDLRPEEVLELFAESARDREIVNALKSRNAVVLVGSRGVGKSFLMRVAEAELRRDFETDRVLPVYLSFTKSSLVRQRESEQFEHWMLAKLCSRVLRALRPLGYARPRDSAIRLLAGGDVHLDDVVPTPIERLEEAFERSWQEPNAPLNLEVLPTVDALKDALEDICESNGIRRLVVLFDEAAHVFMPKQQRAFFTLFRDLRGPFLNCKAAIYPGVTSFGATFQPAHDASMLVLDRDVLDRDYVEQMSEIVRKQADSQFAAELMRNAELLAVLAYAASGNPRLLLKTLTRAERLNREAVNGVLKSFYRTELWKEHTALGEKYLGHKALIDWGRTFVEDLVLPALLEKSVERSEHGGRASAFFWVSKDAPEVVKEALRILSYSGIVIEHSAGTKATRSQIGTRYLVNLGVLFSGLEPNPATQGYELALALDPRRMVEFGANHQAFAGLNVDLAALEETGADSALQSQLGKDVDVLDITTWQRDQLRQLHLNTVGAVLGATETQLQQAYYVGPTRSRRIRNAAVAAVLEYLSG
jgi:hypothetical protein